MTNQNRIAYWFCALPIALLLSATPTACEPQPAVFHTPSASPETLMAQMDAAAAARVHAAEKTYQRIPDAEKTLGDAEVPRQRRRINALHRRNSGSQPVPRLSNVADFLPGGQHYREQNND